MVAPISKHSPRGSRGRTESVVPRSRTATSPTRSVEPGLLSRRGLAYAGFGGFLAFLILAAAVAHSQGPYGFEQPAFRWLGAPASTLGWDRVAEDLGIRVILVALVALAVVGFVRRALFRVAVYAALGGAALFANEYVVKPLVQRSYVGELSFPSGNVTAVCATALAVWLALYPLVGRRTRRLVLVVGVVWTLAMALAVVGAQWHTPVDDLGSLLLCLGVVVGGAAAYEHVAALWRSRRVRERAGAEDPNRA